MTILSIIFPSLWRVRLIWIRLVQVTLTCWVSLVRDGYIFPVTVMVFFFFFPFYMDIIV